MTATKLPYTGRCYNCGKETGPNRRYCDDTCCDKYNTKLRREMEKENRRLTRYNRVKPVKKPVPQERWTAIKVSKAQVEANIERIYQRAKDNGTLGWATLMSDRAAATVKRIQEG